MNIFVARSYGESWPSASSRPDRGGIGEWGLGPCMDPPEDPVYIRSQFLENRFWASHILPPTVRVKEHLRIRNRVVGTCGRRVPALNCRIQSPKRLASLIWIFARHSVFRSMTSYFQGTCLAQQLPGSPRILSRWNATRARLPATAPTA